MLEQEKPRTDIYASGYGKTPTEFRNKALREENDRAANMEAVMSHNMIQALLGRGATKESVLMQQASEMDKLITEERKKPLVGKLAFNTGEGEDTRLVGFDMRGELEEAQDFALRTVVEAEMAPTLDLVRNAQVTLPDGTAQSWQEFTAPAIARQMPEQKAA
jgi:hypothetical protein